jgi:hypothetical protein
MVNTKLEALRNHKVILGMHSSNLHTDQSEEKQSSIFVIGYHLVPCTPNALLPRKIKKTNPPLQFLKTAFQQCTAQSRSQSKVWHLQNNKSSASER